jgi:hypothetical protein
MLQPPAPRGGQRSLTAAALAAPRLSMKPLGREKGAQDEASRLVPRHPRRDWLWRLR